MPIENELGCLQTVYIEHCGKFLQYKIYFIHIEYSLKIHWVRLRPLPQCERNLGYKYLGPDGPGNLGWTPVVSQQTGFPCQILSEGFWAATHLPFHCQSSSTSEQHWVTSAVVHVHMRVTVVGDRRS